MPLSSACSPPRGGGLPRRRCGAPKCGPRRIISPTSLRTCSAKRALPKDPQERSGSRQQIQEWGPLARCVPAPTAAPAPRGADGARTSRASAPPVRPPAARMPGVGGRVAGAEGFALLVGQKTQPVTGPTAATRRAARGHPARAGRGAGNGCAATPPGSDAARPRGGAARPAEINRGESRTGTTGPVAARRDPAGGRRYTRPAHPAELSAVAAG